MNPGVLLCALEREIAPVRQLFPQHLSIANARCPAWRCSGNLGTVDLIRCGMGAHAAEQACCWFKTRKPAFVLLAGFSGGLDPTLKTGQVVVATEVRDQLGTCYPLSLSLEIPGVSRGPILTTIEIVYRVEEKRELYAKTKTLAVDLESAVVARSCHEAGIPFAAVRVISDPAEQALPRELGTILDGERLRMGGLAFALLRRPGLLWELLALAHATKHSATALCEAVQAAFKCLHR